ncbi:MAG TPA: ABC transporter substrate-binding protein [Candidatus Binatia bacterium]|nr:ABC transporter substrate-binding protein [Candidatus Binatia bacterium]
MHGLYTRLLIVALALPLSCAVRPEALGKTYLGYSSESPSASVVYWVAKDAGIFRKHGLDLELIFLNGSVRGIQSLLAGDLRYTAAVGTAAINARLAGGDVTIVQGLLNTLPYFIIGNPNIKSPEDLKGRSAAVHIPGTAADFALRLALMKVGIAYKDIKAVTVGGSAARIRAATSGQLDFTVVTEPEKIQGEKLGLKVIVDMAKLNVPFQFSCVVTTRKMIRESPDEIRRVAWAMAEAIHFYKTHKEQVIKIMEKYTRGLSRPVLEGAYVANRELLVEDTYPTLEGLKNTLEIQATFDPRAAKVKLEDFVDLRFVEEMKKSGFIAKLYGNH